MEGIMYNSSEDTMQLSVHPLVPEKEEIDSLEFPNIGTIFVAHYEETETVIDKDPVSDGK